MRRRRRSARRRRRRRVEDGTDQRKATAHMASEVLCIRYWSPCVIGPVCSTRTEREQSAAETVTRHTKRSRTRGLSVSLVSPTILVSYEATSGAFFY